MRITALRVDGYGTFSDFLVDDLPAGLSVVHGPNETGKSTLLDFVRGVLFGFPDRRSRARYREPLHGGRHGGALGLVDDKGEAWWLERHVGERGVRLTDTAHQAADDGQLTRILGGADDALFRSVFAFGLTELAAFETLESDEVREVVFSAGVLGAGRAATRAQRALRAREEELVRPRQHGAVANGLALRLDELEAELRAARGDAREYPSAKADLEALGERLRAARVHAADPRTRLGDLDRYLSAAPILARRDEARARLGALGELSSTAVVALERAATIEGLRDGLSGFGEQCSTRERLTNSLANITDELASHLDALGGLEASALGASRVAPGAREEAEQLASERAGLAEALRALEENLASDSETERELTERLDAVRSRAGTSRAEVRAAEELDEIALVLAELRRNAAERVRLSFELDAGRREARLASIEHRSRGAYTGVPGISLVVLAAACAGLAGAAIAGRHLVLSVLGLLVAAGALIGAWLLGRRAGDGDGELPEGDALATQLGHLLAESAPLAERLGIDVGTSSAGLESIAERLRIEREQRREIDQLEEALATCQRRSTGLADSIAERRERIDAIDHRASEIGASAGLAPGIAAVALARLLDHLDQARTLSISRASIERGRSTEHAKIAAYLADLEACTTALGGTGGTIEREVPARVGELTEMLATARGERAEREGLVILVEDADRDLAATLASIAPESLARLRDRSDEELADERARLETEVEEAAQAIEDLVTARHDAERLLADQSQSARIAELELAGAGVAEELDEAIEQFAALHLARTMVAETLARYERERQPVVIARAAELFASVTDSRYVSLVAREDPDGRRHGIVAIDARGAHVDAVDLSSGTVEQLYLCLRLAFAETFADGAVALPLVLDDVLVNFDPNRAAAVARVVAEIAGRHQVLAFTCHPEIVDLFIDAAPDARLVSLATTR